MKRKELDLERFLPDVATHELTILRDEGIYRHIVLQKPKHSWDMRFQIVTFPGTLVYTGDMGTFVFSRIPDMFQFFRRHKDRPIEINPSYWSEKVDARDRDGINHYDADAFREFVRNRLDDAGATAEERAEVESMVMGEAEENEHYATSALTHYRQHSESGEKLFGDLAGFDPTVYTFRYLWCCFALVWAIDKYDDEMARRATLTGQRASA